MLKPLTATGAWRVGDTYQLTVVVSSLEAESRAFGFAGGGGFLPIDVPAGAKEQEITVTDTICGGRKTRFEYRGAGNPGEVWFSKVRLCKVTPTSAQRRCKRPRNKKLPPPTAYTKDPVAKGAKKLPTVSNSDFEIGQELVIDAGTPLEESNRIKGFGSLILEFPLQFAHDVGAVATTVDEEDDAFEEPVYAFKEPVVEPEKQPVALDGATASLDAAGFLATTNMCCPFQMETFFNRLLHSKGYDVCSKTHVQGLMHWFHCVPEMEFQYVIDVINNGNPCKYWGPEGEVCPVLSPECAGEWCR